MEEVEVFPRGHEILISAAVVNGRTCVGVVIVLRKHSEVFPMVPPNTKMNTRKASVQSLNDGEVEISKLISELEGDSKNIVLILSNQLNSFRSEFTELLTAKNDEISALKTKVAVLEDKVVKLETSIDDNDAYERKDTVIFSGSSIPAGEVGENCGEVIRSVARESLRIEMSLSEISVAHRLGRKPQN